MKENMVNELVALFQNQKFQSAVEGAIKEAIEGAIKEAIEQAYPIKEIKPYVLSVKEVADYFKVTVRTIYNWLKNGKISGRMIGGQWRFKKEKIDKLMD